MPHGWFAVLAFGAAFASYLLLAGSLTWTEGTAAIAVACATAGFTTVHRIRHGRLLVLKPPPGQVLRRTLTGLVTDTFRVGAALAGVRVRGQGGEATWQAFRPEDALQGEPGSGSAHDAGRRALVTMLTSVAPNGFVLDITPSVLPDADHALLLHRLVPAPPLSGADWPS